MYEELNDLHEETVDIVLARDREVRKHLAALKKEIADVRNYLPALRRSRQQLASDTLILVFCHIVVAFTIWTIVHH